MFVVAAPPLYRFEPLEVLPMIVALPPPQLVSPLWSASFRDFVAQCLTLDPAKRPDAAALIKVGIRFSASLSFLI